MNENYEADNIESRGGIRSTLIFKSTSQVINPALGACFITKFILLAQVVSSLPEQNRGLKHEALHVIILKPPIYFISSSCKVN